MSRPSAGEDPEFRKSTFSAEGNCLEVAQIGGEIVLRNSRSPDTEIIRLTTEEWAAFTEGIQHGELRFG